MYALLSRQELDGSQLSRLSICLTVEISTGKMDILLSSHCHYRYHLFGA
jgi:hypothetical protein